MNLKEQAVFWGELIARVVIGAIFIYAGFMKIQDPAAFAKAVDSYQMLPSVFVGLIAVVLPMTELIAGLALVFTKWSRESALLILAMLVVFLVGLSQASIRGLEISCGCFGEDEGVTESIGMAIVRDLLMLVPTVWLVIRPSRKMFDWQISLGLFMLMIAAGLSAGRISAFFSRNAEDGTRSMPTSSFASRDAMPTNGPSDGVSSGGFFANMAKAKAEKRPFIMVVEGSNCMFCARLKDVLHTDVFKRWCDERGLLLSEGRYHMTNSIPEEAELIRFVKAIPREGKVYLPRVGIYWPKPSGEEFSTVFCGRRGKMPVMGTDSLIVQFANALDFVLDEYMKTVDKRTKMRDFLAAAPPRKFAVVCEGGGTVKMSPKSGLLADDTKSGFLTCQAYRGWKFKGWYDPEGRFLRKTSWLSLSYFMPEGTYRAVLEKVDKKVDKE